jgi:hypothetical protein
MKIYFNNFWENNENIYNNLFYFWKHFFSFIDIEISKNIHECDIVLNSVFFKKDIEIYKNKKNIFITFEPIKYNNILFDVNLSFHLKDEEYKNVITCPPQLLLTIFKHEVPKSLFLKNRPFRTEVPPKFCCFITRQEKYERMDFFNQLSKYKKVDSLGPCLNNTGILAPSNEYEFYKLVSQYKFIITFENSQKDFYITEKILHGFFSLTIPIYWGSKFIHNFFNKDSFIYIDDYNKENIHKSIEQIKLLDNNNELYLKYVNQPIFKHNFDIDTYFENIKSDLKLKLKIKN